MMKHRLPIDGSSRRIGMKRCAVVGIGAVGSILSAHLLKAGIDVTLVDTLKERLNAIKKKGLKVRDPRGQIIGDFVVHSEKHLFSVKDIKQSPDCIFICTKTYSLMEVARGISENFSPPTKVIVFQNGLDNEEQAAQVFGKENVLRCINNYAGMMTSDTEVDITFFNPPNYIGAMDRKIVSTARELAEVLTRAGIKTKCTDDVKKPEWDKALLNSCLAPVCAVTGLTMKDVMDSAHLREIVENLLDEGIKVAERVGIEFSEDFHESSMSYLSKGGHHKPSMLTDLEKGSETEIGYFNGKIVEYGEKYGVQVPFHRMITALVRGLEKKGRERAG
jgi:2-dehydropantoate 2-reductase